MAEPSAAVKPRILATDDQEEVLRLIARTLDSRYECEFAGNVVEGRRKLRGGVFDLALCDIEMPGESGIALAEEIIESFPQTAVVLVTGVDDPDVADAALRLGVHGYLVKPFRPGQLMITAMSALRRKRLECAQRAHTKLLEERLRLLMDRAPIPIYMKDRERRYVLANRSIHEVCGKEPYEMIGLRSAEVLGPGNERALAETDERVLRDGATLETEETFRFGGKDRTFLTARFPFVDDSGEIAGIYGISREITDRKQAELLRERLTESQERAIDELRASRQETVERLALAIERHDSNTGAHVNRMAAVAAFLGRRCGLNEESVTLLRAAAPMHDVGKVATPDAILRKPGPLTEEERMVMQEHTLIGNEILAGSSSDLLQMAARIALTHHERWDGSGYPNGLEAEEIPLEGRIVAVADVFDALLSDRCYRPAMTVDEATRIIGEGKGAHFDPGIADDLLENLEEALSLRG